MAVNKNIIVIAWLAKFIFYKIQSKILLQPLL